MKLIASFIILGLENYSASWWGPTIYHRELYSVLCSDLCGKRIREWIYVYVYNWFTLLYSRTWHSIINQLYANKNFKKENCSAKYFKYLTFYWNKNKWVSQPRTQWQPGGVGWDGKWEGGSGERGHMYTCDWFMLMYGRNQHNVVKLLSSNLKNCFKKKWVLLLWLPSFSLWGYVVYLVYTVN